MFVGGRIEGVCARARLEGLGVGEVRCGLVGWRNVDARCRDLVSSRSIGFNAECRTRELRLLIEIPPELRCSRGRLLCRGEEGVES